MRGMIRGDAFPRAQSKCAGRSVLTPVNVTSSNAENVTLGLRRLGLMGPKRKVESISKFQETRVLLTVYRGLFD